MDRPILFSAAMVRALLDGRKTQTRRVLNPHPPAGARYSGIHYASYEPASHFFNCDGGGFKVRQRFEEGDELYVRERGAIAASKNAFQPFVGNEPNMDLKSPAWPRSPDGTPYRPCPGIHMPRWASRLTLTVTEVRVERLQDISQQDAIAEGPGFIGKITGEVCDSATAHRLGLGPRWRTARDWYADLWDSLNAHRGVGWETNPWVVAVSFTVERRNIDEAM